MYKSSVGYSLTNKGFDSEVGFKVVKGFGVTPLVFSLQPQSKTVDEYLLATFNVVVTGGVEPYTFQWKKGGISVGTNSPSVSFSTAATDNGASITCVVTDSAGSVITSDAAALGVTSYTYQLDGLTQYFWLSEPVVFAVGGSVEIDVVIPISAPASDAYLIDGSTRAYLFIKPDRTFFYNASRILFTLDGAPLASGSQIPLDGLPHKIVGVYQGEHNLQSVGISYPLTGSTSFSGIIKGLLMVRAAGNIAIPLNNKGQGANQLATVGGVDATIVNYNASGWVAV